MVIPPMFHVGSLHQLDNNSTRLTFLRGEAASFHAIATALHQAACRHKLSSCLLSKALRQEDVDPRFLDLSTSWSYGAIFTPNRFLSRGKSPFYRLHRRLSGPRNRSGRDGKAKILSLPYSNFVSSVFQPVASCCTGCTITAPAITLHAGHRTMPLML
jgi:hypothetical protein